MNNDYDLDHWPEDDYDYPRYYDEEPYEEPYPENPNPPTGILSLGPVWLGCNYHEYNNVVDHFPQLMWGLTLEQAEELVNFAVSLDRICPVEENCEYMTRDRWHLELAFLARQRGDQAMCERHLAQVADPKKVYATIADCELEALLLAQLTASE